MAEPLPNEPVTLADHQGKLLHSLAQDVGTIYNLAVLMSEQVTPGTQLHSDVIDIKNLTARFKDNFVLLQKLLGRPAPR